jgi:uncharacterized membrane protein
MDFYSIFKLLHVLCAIAWVGGGLTLLVASILASAAKSTEGMFAGLDIMNRLGKTWFIPVSFLTVIFGAVTATFGGMWAELWVILGLAGFASTFFTGLLLLEPQGRRIAALMAAGDTDGALAAGKRLLTIGKFDYTVMLLVIADMVLKPGFGDVAIWGAMAVVMIAGAAVFLGPLAARTPAAPASA